MTLTTPKEENYKQPAEWEKHRGCWLAWPSHADLWQNNLEAAQREFTALVQSIGASEKLFILVQDDTTKKEAVNALAGLPVTFYSIPFGDIWLRDTAPLFLKGKNNQQATVRFRFNGWGEKYVLSYDADISQKIAVEAGFKEFVFSEVLEGGSVEVNGAGLCLTTKQCVLNKNRNEKITQDTAEQFLKNALGVDKVLWLAEGLLNDHTDGHIDTLARFSDAHTVLCMKPAGQHDPNATVLKQIAHDLKTFTDNNGEPLKVIEIPSPGRILDQYGKIMPASYMNFYISNDTVIVPTYGSENDQRAVDQIGEYFPSRKTIGLSAKAILSGGGAFHCITQQQPL